MTELLRSIQAIRPNPWGSGLFLFLLFISLLNCQRKTGSDVVTPNPPPTPATQMGSLTIGTFKEDLSEPVSTQGGKLQILDAASSLNGFSIEIPAGAYPNNRTFKITHAPVEKHAYGSDFVALSPLIHLDNQGNYAQQTMTVRIPVNIPNNHFAAVIAPKEDKTLEILPILSMTRTQITVLLTHMDYATTVGSNGRASASASGLNLIVLSTEESNLKNIEAYTTFVPGVDDWEFANHGTYNTPSGNCSAMSRTALWYFLNKKEKEKPLYSNLNFGNSNTNKAGFDRNKFWMVNDLAMKWVSMVQLRSTAFEAYLLRFKEDRNEAEYEAIQRNLIKFHFKILNQLGRPTPLFLGIGNGSSLRHAILAIGITPTSLLVADPNFPGKIGTVPFEGDGFGTYLSGGDIVDNPRPYNAFLAIPYSQLNGEFIASSWASVQDGTVGKGCFEATTFEFKDQSKKAILKNGVTIAGNTIEIIPSCSDCRIRLHQANGDTIKRIRENTFSLPPGQQTIGIFVIKKNRSVLCNGNKSGESREGWGDFQWFEITTDPDFYSYKINGTPFAPNGQSFVSDGTGKSWILFGSFYSADGSHYKVGQTTCGLFVYKDKLKGPGTYVLDGTDGYAYVWIVKTIDPVTKNHFDYIYGSYKGQGKGPGTGLLTVTSMTENYIEGVFNFSGPEIAPESNPTPPYGATATITDGKFKMRIK